MPSTRSHKISNNPKGGVRVKTNNHKFIFYTIEGSKIKSIFTYDIMLGTTLYYVFKALFSIEILSLIGCIVGTEAVKRLRNCKFT